MNDPDPPLQFRLSHALKLDRVDQRTQWLIRIGAAGLSAMVTIGLAILTVLMQKGGG